MLKASHWSRNVHWDIVVVKSFGGKFATCSDGNYRGLKFSPMGANMKTRLESKIVCNSRKQAVLLTKFGCNIHLAALTLEKIPEFPSWIVLGFYMDFHDYPNLEKLQFIQFWFIIWI